MRPPKHAFMSLNFTFALITKLFCKEADHLLTSMTFPFMLPSSVATRCPSVPCRKSTALTARSLRNKSFIAHWDGLEPAAACA